MLMIKHLLWQELWVHIPLIRKRKIDPMSCSVTPLQSNVDIHSTETALVLTIIAPHIQISISAHVFTQFVPA